MTAEPSAQSVRDTIILPFNIARVVLRSRGSEAIILHNGRFKRMPSSVLIPLMCKTKRNSISRPSNLTILMVHNRPYKTVMEQSLEYLGIHDYTTIRVSRDREWRQSRKITEIANWLNTGGCKTDYVLFSDADDAIMRDDPTRAMALLDKAGSEMLVSCTRYSRYHGMKDVEAWTVSVAPMHLKHNPSTGIHLNSGVYIARTDFLRDFVNEAARFVTAHDLSGVQLSAIPDEEVRQTLPDFPRGSGDDQLIFRLLMMRYYPRIKLDYDGQLAQR